MNDSKSFREMGKAFQTANNELARTLFESPDGQNLIQNPDNHFDLLIIEAQFSTYTIFSWKYDIPYIGECALRAKSKDNLKFNRNLLVGLRFTISRHCWEPGASGI